MFEKDSKKIILRNYKSKSNIYAILQTLMPVILTFLLILCASAMKTPYSLLLVVPIGWSLYRLYFPLHDLCHENLFQNKKSRIKL